MSELRMALHRGVLVRIVVNRFADQNAEVQSLLLETRSAFSHCQLWSFDGGQNVDLHSKLVCVDGAYAIIGSSNLSYRGLVTNYELGLMVTGPLAADLETKVLSLLSDPLARRL
jgi:phosphatidylserine/phosphatidylglycerophosphate/cardiolipin synthase-like enzyme